MISAAQSKPVPHTAQSTRAPFINFSSLKDDRWSAEEANNARTVVNFFQKLMNEHAFDEVLDKHAGNYIQHNRAIPTGIPGLVGYVRDVVKRYPDYAFDVKRVIASGDVVVLHSHATFKAKHRGDESKGFIITDTFRLDDGQLVEHWDAIQPIDFMTRLLFLMIGGKVANTHPTF